MKIAIMTQPLGKNYGGIMQAWALQQVLKRMGHEPVTIDRQAEFRKPLYRIVRYIYRTLLYVSGKRKVSANFDKNIPYILKNTKEFIGENIEMSVPIGTTKMLRNHFKYVSYDAVIVGSDQVWRPKYSPNIYNFFLDFTESIELLRVSYAASFGVNINEFTTEQAKKCKEMLSRFNSVSVREQGGKELCKEVFDRDAEFVLDPTLLLTKEDYAPLLPPDSEKASQQIKIFTYWLDGSKEKSLLAARIAERKSGEVHTCYAKVPLSEASESVEDCVLPPVEEWLNSFNKADFVLTDSFHGVAFSIIFQKPFYAVANLERGADRFYSLLDTLGLADRIIRHDAVSNFKEQKTSINWMDVSEKLKVMQSRSSTFLEEALSGRLK